MAKSEKKDIPPSTYQVEAPKTIAPIMQAFHADSEEAIRELIQEAAQVIYGDSDSEFDIFNSRKKEIEEEELELVTSLMKGINPQDTLETLYAAQIAVTHMMGMHKLASTYADDQKLGLKLLKFCGETVEQLGKKQNGGSRNITVNHNYNGEGNTLTQTIIPNKEK